MKKSKSKQEQELFQILCPCCGGLLWIDPLTKQVVQSEKGKKRKEGSLEELLLKEKKKREEMERRFQVTAELEKKKRKKAQEKFENVLSQIGQDED